MSGKGSNYQNKTRPERGGATINTLLAVFLLVFVAIVVPNFRRAGDIRSSSDGWYCQCRIQPVLSGAIEMYLMDNPKSTEKKVGKAISENFMNKLQTSKYFKATLCMRPTHRFMGFGTKFRPMNCSFRFTEDGVICEKHGSRKTSPIER